MEQLSDELASSLSGEHIAKMLRTDGPVVSCVILHSSPHIDNDNSKPAPKNTSEEATREVLTDLISEIKIDTTPKKQCVAQQLGGPFTFLGQYEDEGIVIIVRRPEYDDNAEVLKKNPHKLQPPLHNAEVLGDILLMRVAPVDPDPDPDPDTDTDVGNATNDDDKKKEGVDSETHTETTGTSAAGAVMSNEDFFLNYTKEEYIKFASRTDIVASDPELPQQEEYLDGEESEDHDDDNDEDDEGEYNLESDEDDMEDDEESQIGMMNLILAQIIRRFREEHGRGPNTEELLAMRSALAEKLGIDESLINESAATTGASGTADPQLRNDETAQREKRKSDDDSKSSEQRAKRVKFNNEKNQVKILYKDEGYESESSDCLISEICEKNDEDEVADE